MKIWKYENLWLKPREKVIVDDSVLPKYDLIGHSDLVSCVKFSPNGKNIVSGSYDRTIKIWDIENGSLL